MKTDICVTCSNEVPELAFFCPSCTSQVKCKKCHEKLVKNAKACISCGTLTESTADRTALGGAMNTIKFRETKDERTYEVAFTNDVGKEVSELVANMVKNNLQNKALQPKADTSHLENIEEKETIDIDIKPHSESKFEESGNLESNNFPPLNDIEMTFDCNEVEWIAIYAFYISKYGTITFSKDQVYEKYKSKRFTETRRKNFSTNWKSLFNSHITTVKEDEFRFKPEGIRIITHILNGKSNNEAANGSTIKKSNAKAPKSGTQRKTVPKNVSPEEFDIFNKKKTLEALYKEKLPGDNTGFRMLVIAYYVTKINGNEYFTDGNIEYAYRALTLNKRPNFLHQTLVNLAGEKVWFEKFEVKEKDAWKLTRIGESFVEDKLPETKAEK